MSVVDDVRKLLQDVVTPDLRALDARLVALDKKLDATAHTLNEKIDLVSRTLNEKIDSTSQSLNEKLDSTAQGLNAKLDSTAYTLNQKMDANAFTLDHKIEQTRDYLLVEMRSTKASTDANIANLTHSLDLERRIARIESDRAAQRDERRPA